MRIDLFIYWFNRIDMKKINNNNTIKKKERMNEKNRKGKYCKPDKIKQLVMYSIPQNYWEFFAKWKLSYMSWQFGNRLKHFVLVVNNILLWNFKDSSMTHNFIHNYYLPLNCGGQRFFVWHKNYVPQPNNVIICGKDNDKASVLWVLF